MNLSQVKLVVFDMDGTLLNDDHQVSDRFFKQYEVLKQNGIQFAAASGRQLQSIRHALNPIQDEINIIGENGGILQYNDEVLTLQKLEDTQVKKCIDLIRTIKNAYLVLCGKNAAYIEQTNPQFLHLFRNYYHEVKQVEDLKTISDDDFLKIAVFHFKSSESYLFPRAIELRKELKVIVSAKNWLDISPLHSNKGYALKILQKNLGIAKEQTLVFGDYNNDLEMLKLGDFSFAMANAHPDVKKVAKYMTKSNNKQGVETILERLIVSKHLYH